MAKRKFVLQSKEEGHIEIQVDTKSFIGPKSKTLFVTTQQEGGTFEEHRIGIQVISEESWMTIAVEKIRRAVDEVTSAPPVPPTEPEIAPSAPVMLLPRDFQM